MNRILSWRASYFEPIPSFSQADFNAPLQYAYISTIFREFINQIQSINRRIYTPVDLDQFGYETLHQRCTKPRSFKLKEENEAEFETCDYRLQKLYYVSDFVCTVLHATKIELYKNDEYTILANLLTNIESMKQDDNVVLHSKEMEIYENWNTELKLLEARIKQTDNEKTVLSARLLTEYEDLKSQCDQNKLYLQKWEDASQEQLSYTYKIKNNKMEKEIIDVKQNIEDELISHSSILTYLLTNISDMQKNIDFWSKKYHKQCDKLDVKIRQIKEKREDIKERTAQLQKEYETKEKEIEKLLICKEKWKEERIKAKQQEEERLMQIIEQQMIINLKRQQSNSTPKRKTSTKKKSRRRA